MDQPTHSSLAPASGRKRPWVAPNGTTVVLPVAIEAWELDPVTGERQWTVTAVVELVDGQPLTTRVEVNSPDGIQEERLQRDFRWKTPADIVRLWIPEQLEAGKDPFDQEPPVNWWLMEGRYELTDDFLQQIANRYLELGRGYAKPMAAEYRTSVRTVRSWIDKARERGVLGPAVGQGKTGARQQ